MEKRDSSWPKIFCLASSSNVSRNVQLENLVNGHCSIVAMSGIVVWDRAPVQESGVRGEVDEFVVCGVNEAYVVDVDGSAWRFC